MGEVAADDFNIGTKAALSGGTTTILDFVIPKPQQSLLEAYHEWRAKADHKVNCDYGLHVAITWWDDKITPYEMEQLVKVHGVQSFKIFVAYKGAIMLGDEGMIKALEKAKELGAVVMVHAENGEMVDWGQKHIYNLGITGPEGHRLSRPENTEACATHMALS